MDSKNRYLATKKVYSKLGVDYINRVDKVVPTQIFDFIKILPPRGRILDVGFAGGRDTKIFLEAGLEVIGIEMVDIFLRKAKNNIIGAKFLKMDLLDLDFSPNYFDAIWANAVLLHIEKKDISKALKGFYEKLKPNGKLHLRVKKGKGTAVVSEPIADGYSRIFTYFSKSELETDVKKSGFKIILSKFSEDELKRKNVRWITVWAEK